MTPFTANLNLEHAPTIVKFLEDRSDIRIIKGPVGSGKTTGLCFEVLRVAMDQEKSPRDGIRYTRPVVLRNTYSELKTTTIQTWKENFPEDIFGTIGGTPPISQHIIIPGELDCEVYFLAMDQPKDVRKLLSLNISHIYFNEMREFNEEIVLAAWDRVGRFPNRAADKHGVECTYPCMIGDTNPPDEDHWMYTWEHGGDDTSGEKIEKSLKFFNQPGAVLDVSREAHRHKDVINAAGRQYIVNPLAENIPNLPTRYYEKKLPFNNLERIRVYYESKYGVVGHGKPVCPEYNDDMMSVEDLKVLKDQPLIIGADVGGGTLSPSAIIGQRHPRGIILIHAEIVCFDMGVEEFSNQVNQTLAELFPGRELEEGWGDPAGVKRDEIYETVVFDHLKSKDIPMRGAQTNDIGVRVEATRLPMTRLIDGKPGILINKRCKVLRAGLAGKWVYRRLQVAGAERYADKPDKGKYSHVCFVKGTQINTPDGQKSIEKLKIGDLVSTPFGACKITNTGNRFSKTMQIELSSSKKITCTPDHPFWQAYGYSPADMLHYGDRLYTEENKLWMFLFWLQRSVLGESTPYSNTKESDTIESPLGDITKVPILMAINICIGWCGKTIMASYLMVARSIMRITHPRIIISPICECYPARITPGTIWPIPVELKSPPGIYRALSKALRKSVTIIRSGQEISIKKHGKRLPEQLRQAKKKWSVLSAVKSIWESLQWSKEVTVAGIVRPRPGAEETVYNITVEEAHCYFAEGVLVSNCDALGYFNMGTGEFKAIQGRKKMSNRKPITVKTGWDVFK